MYFGISENVTFKVKLVDSMNYWIKDIYLKDIVKSHYHHEHFFIEVLYDVDFNKTAKIVTPFVNIINIF